jgi:upstream activation factor subunit UAF30
VWCRICCVPASRPRKRRNNSHLGSVLSEPMQAFLGGVESMPRTQVVKAIWDYIKANSLQVGHRRITKH